MGCILICQTSNISIITGHPKLQLTHPNIKSHISLVPKVIVFIFEYVRKWEVTVYCVQPRALYLFQQRSFWIRVASCKQPTAPLNAETMINSWAIASCALDARVMEHELVSMLDKALCDRASAHGPSQFSRHAVLTPVRQVFLIVFQWQVIASHL